MMWHAGWSWWMGFGMFAFWVVVVLGVWVVVRASGPRERGPEEILAERFAHGEIGAEEYEERRRVLAKR